MTNRIKELRHSKNLSQLDLARILGVSTSTIGMYEQGRREPNNKMLLKLAQALDVSVDYLIGATDIMERFDIELVSNDIAKHLIDNPALMFNNECYTQEELTELCSAIEQIVKKTLIDRLKPKESSKQ